MGYISSHEDEGRCSFLLRDVAEPLTLKTFVVPRVVETRLDDRQAVIKIEGLLEDGSPDEPP